MQRKRIPDNGVSFRKPSGETGFVLKSVRKLPDFYAVLGVNASATARQIEEAYYALAYKHHPDHGGDGHKFAEISEAKATLFDKDRRAKYDAKRKLLHKKCPECQGRGVTFKTKGFTTRSSITCRACGGSGVL